MSISTAKPAVTVRRSVLYMPANNPKLLIKAQSLAADALIFDFEDAVAPNEKEQARNLFQEAIAKLDFGAREVLIRINGIDTAAYDGDLKMLRELTSTLTPVKFSGVVLPKVESRSDIERLVQDIKPMRQNPESCFSFDSSKDNMFSVWPMIETPKGVRNVYEIASAKFVDCLVAGTSDLSKELRLESCLDRSGLQHSLSSMVLAAAERGIDVLDGVCLNLSSDEQLKRDCLQGRRLGFTGKTLIHPKQIDCSNQVFGISETQRSWAERVVEVWQQAISEGKGLAVLDGKLIEVLHYNEAVAVLEKYQLIASRQAS